MKIPFKREKASTSMVPFNPGPTTDFNFNIDVKSTQVLKTKKRAYHSARKVNYLNNWISSPTSPHLDIKAGLMSLRARSREAVQNNSFVRRFLALVKTNVIGDTGIILQSRVVFKDNKPDQAARGAIEDAWTSWGRYGSPDVTGQKTWLQMTNDVMQQIMMDGEYLAMEVYSNDNPFRFQLQVLDPMLLDITYKNNLSNGHYIRESIEYNKSGKPLAYHLIEEDDPDYTHYPTGRKYRRIPASRIYHIFAADFVNQRRGVPIFACALLRLGMLDGYTEAELVAARLGASTMGIWTDNAEGHGYQGQKAENYDDDGNLLPNDDSEYINSASPGEFIRAPHGAKLDVFDPNHPNAGYSQFTSDLLREIASGLGVSYASLSNNYSDANYSSLRQAALVEQDTWKAMQKWLIDHFVMRVYESWLEHSINTGAITINGRTPSFDTPHYLKHTWQPKRWAWVDPAKEMKANELAISLNISSPQEIIRDKGRDPEVVLDEIEEWNKQLESRNINKPSVEGFFDGDEDEQED